MKILVICGDYWHPPEVARTGLSALAGTGFVLDWLEDTRDWDPRTMMDYPLVILARSDNVSHTDQTEWMTDFIQAAFSDYVQRGNGLLAIHSGTAEYDQKPILRDLLGGVFHHHPEQCLVTMKPHPDHPLCKGISPFSVMDEHYFMTLDDARADVFLTTESVNGVQPGAWRRTAGVGRVAVLTPGHNLEVWLHPGYRAILRNTIHWCIKLKA